jgi:hypothetical protein
MADSSPTIGELFRAKAVTGEQVSALVEAYLEDREAGRRAIADGYVVDLSAAVSEHAWAARVIANKDAGSVVKRNAVRTAILLARAQKA